MSTIIISGYRNFNDFDLFYNCIDNLPIEIGRILAGDCRGTDSMAIKYARMVGVPWKKYKANWKLFGDVAGPIRNKEMLVDGNILIAFDHEKSNGTKDIIRQAQGLGKKVIIFKIKYDESEKKWKQIT